MFKLTFKNLGPIREAKLELRPLTVIIGANNTGKTYLAYATYALLTKLRGASSAIVVEAWPPRLNDTAEALTQQTERRLAEGVQQWARLAPEELTEFFQDTMGWLFHECEVVGDSFASTEAFAAEAGELLRAFKARAEDDDFILTRLMEQSLMMALLEAFPRPVMLPAERNAFIISYRMLANRRYRVLRDGIRGLRSPQSTPRQVQLLHEQGDVRYPTPLEDFLDFLSDVELSSPKPTSADAFQELAAQLERGVQGGHELFFEPTALGGRELRVKLDERRSLDLYNASSSIKQLAPLLLYLRYRAAKGDLLIIDEPEMNLHPEGQVRLLEVLAILANLGVYVLVTTHSPYILSHLNNLIASTSKLKPTRLRQAKALYLDDRRAFLPADKVSAYEARGGTLHDLHDPDFGIRWDTLSDVSTELQQKFFAIREQELGKGRGRAKKN
jgi:AAA domain, putative AbiEii toxin, Type IV TA system/AAA ATPase domain